MGCSQSDEIHSVEKKEKLREEEIKNTQEIIDQIINDIWVKYDKDNNKTLEFDEMKVYLKTTFSKVRSDHVDTQDLQEPSEEELKNTFDKFDQNHNGTIERNEMENLLYDMLKVPKELRKSSASQ